MISDAPMASRSAESASSDSLCGEGKLRATSSHLGPLGFEAACEAFLAERRTEIQDVQHERQLSKPLRRYFGTRKLKDVAAVDVRAYQAFRLAAGKHPATINHEVKFLFRMLRRAKLLHAVRDDVKLLRIPKAPWQMLTAEQKYHIFQTASQRPEWQRAYCAALVTSNTSLRPVELKRLLWPDVDQKAMTVTVRKSKTDAGSRIIPLNEEALAAINALKTAAIATGAYGSDCFVFHRLWPKPDPRQPMGKGGWRSAWRSLRKAAGLPKLRFYDLRHQFVTELAENGVPEMVIRELAGHVDPAMTRWYAHPRMEARRAAVEKLSRPGEGGGPTYVTNHVTNGGREAVPKNRTQ